MYLLKLIVNIIVHLIYCLHVHMYLVHVPIIQPQKAIFEVLLLHVHDRQREGC